MESFFATLKGELLVDAHWATRDDAERAVADYIERWYNLQWRHSSLAYASPMECTSSCSHVGGLTTCLRDRVNSRSTAKLCTLSARPIEPTILPAGNHTEN